MIRNRSFLKNIQKYNWFFPASSSNKMYKIGEEETVCCPYNRFHIVSKLRIQKHITKCKKNYPDVKLATCFYNYTHRLRPEDMLRHYEICSQKTRIEVSRYPEPQTPTSSNVSVKSDSFSEQFPDINVKPRVFAEPDALSTCSSQTLNDGESDSSGSQMIGDDDDDSDDDLEPLPLPKTVSKAFVYVNKEPNRLTPETSQTQQIKAFGRGKNFMSFSPPEISRIDHSFGGMESAKKTRNEDPVLFTNGISQSIPSSVIKYKLNSVCMSLSKDCTESVTSSMFDDTSTFKSVDVISADESTEEDDDDDGLIFTKLNKCLKI